MSSFGSMQTLILPRRVSRKKSGSYCRDVAPALRLPSLHDVHEVDVPFRVYAVHAEAYKMGIE
jgi:hypothetical protein